MASEGFWVRILVDQRVGTLAIPFTPLCQGISEETLKAAGPCHVCCRYVERISSVFDIHVNKQRTQDVLIKSTRCGMRETRETALLH